MLGAPLLDSCLWTSIEDYEASAWRDIMGEPSANLKTHPYQTRPMIAIELQILFLFILRNLILRRIFLIIGLTTISVYEFIRTNYDTS